MALSAYAGTDFQVIRDALALCLAESRPVVIRSDYRRIQRPHIALESIVCPLVDPEQDRDFIVSAIGYLNG